MDWLRGFIIQDLAAFRQGVGVGGPFSLLSMTGALVCAWIAYAVRRRARGRKTNLRAFIRGMAPSWIVFNPSTRIDLKLWILNVFVLAAGYGMLAVAGVTWRNLTIGALTHVFGAHAPTAWPVWIVMTLATLLELLAYEFAYWYVHYLCHKIPVLWEFHKVHHSAEVLTVMTEMRQHPVEIIAVVNGISLTTGLVFGVMTYVFGPGIGALTLFNANIVLMLFLVTYGHLRHTHVWIAFTGLAGKILVSPAHHQIHHSTNPKHYDKNLGFALSVWDWAFGTLYVPSKTSEVEAFGVTERHEDFHTIARVFYRPVLRAGEHVMPAGAPIEAPKPERMKGAAV
jgi:sterol desaturase/sphingolipid hydroxylase (fatty acid hydroxylase superfamily)